VQTLVEVRAGKSDVGSNIRVRLMLSIGLRVACGFIKTPDNIPQTNEGLSPRSVKRLLENVRTVAYGLSPYDYVSSALRGYMKILSVNKQQVSRRNRNDCGEIYPQISGSKRVRVCDGNPPLIELADDPTVIRKA